jgi:hypothetical protein
MAPGAYFMAARARWQSLFAESIDAEQVCGDTLADEGGAVTLDRRRLPPIRFTIAPTAVQPSG